MRIQRIFAEKQYVDAERCNVVCTVVSETQKSTSSTVAYSILQNDMRDCSEISIDQSIHAFNTTLNVLFEGKSIDLSLIDNALEELYGSYLSSLMYPSLIQGFSIACARMQALEEEMTLPEFFAYVLYNETVTIPYPFFRIDTTGLSAAWFIEEVFLLPLGARSFRHAREMFSTIKQDLEERVKSCATVTDLFQTIKDVLLANRMEDLFVVAICARGNQKYVPDKGYYEWDNCVKTSEELLYFYRDIIDHYRVFSIENAFDLKDVLGSSAMLESYGSKVQLVVKEALQLDQTTIIPANAVALHLEDFLTISQVLTHIVQLKGENINIIIEQSDGDYDLLAVDCAIGASVGQVKPSPLLEKEFYTRLLDIEDEMTLSSLDTH